MMLIPLEVPSFPLSSYPNAQTVGKTPRIQRLEIEQWPEKRSLSCDKGSPKGTKTVQDVQGLTVVYIKSIV